MIDRRVACLNLAEQIAAQVPPGSEMQGRRLRTLLPLIWAENILKSHDIGDRVPARSRRLPARQSSHSTGASLAPTFSITFEADRPAACSSATWDSNRV
jgi:hypothetical protein